MTRANGPQTSLALDSGATIYFFSNQDLLQSIKESDKAMKIHCGRTTFDQEMIGRLKDKLKYLLLLKGDVCITKDDIANFYPWENWWKKDTG